MGLLPAEVLGTSGQRIIHSVSKKQLINWITMISVTAC